MKNDPKNAPPVQCAGGSNTGDSSVGSRVAVVVAEPKLRALRSIALMVTSLSDVVQSQVDLSDVEAERLSSLIGGLYDVLSDAEGGRPAERSEAERGSLKDSLRIPRHHELIEALAADVNTTVAALENLRAGFARVADERDRLQSAARVSRGAMQAALDDDGGLNVLSHHARRAFTEALGSLKTGLDPAPKEQGRAEAPAFDASEHERPRALPPKVIHLDAGPAAVHNGSAGYTLNDYQRDALRTASPEAEGERGRPLNLAINGLGIAGEAGEVADLLKKHTGHGHELPRSKVEKELGDVLWYTARIADLFGLTLADVAHANRVKLEARYPNGFSHEASRNREVAP